MLTVPVYNPAGEKVGEETIDPADFGGEVNKQLLHDVVLDAPRQPSRRHGEHTRPGRRGRLRQEAVPPERTGNARAGSSARTSEWAAVSPSLAAIVTTATPCSKKAVRAAIRMALLSKLQDGQALIIDGAAPTAPKTKQVAQVLCGRSDARTSPRPKPSSPTAKPRPRPGRDRSRIARS